MNALLDDCKEVDAMPRSSGLAYSICVVANNLSEYAAMVESFRSSGFSGADCEYLYVDNSNHNKYDAYAAYNLFLQAAKGEYIILCHQDVVLIEDGRRALDHIIESMSLLDPKWAILGNAGRMADGSSCACITDPHGVRRVGRLPARVRSVDENFIVVKRSANLALSSDLSGFHLYGADLCIMASMLGFNAYVVAFHLRHKSAGSANESFFAARSAIIRKYEAALRWRWVFTPSTILFLSQNRILNRVLNSRPMVDVLYRTALIYKYSKLVRAIGSVWGGSTGGDR
jgi:hypothetical protein